MKVTSFFKMLFYMRLFIEFLNTVSKAKNLRMNWTQNEPDFDSNVQG